MSTWDNIYLLVYPLFRLFPRLPGNFIGCGGSKYLCAPGGYVLHGYSFKKQQRNIQFSFYEYLFWKQIFVMVSTENITQLQIRGLMYSKSLEKFSFSIHSPLICIHTLQVYVCIVWQLFVHWTRLFGWSSKYHPYYTVPSSHT